MPASVTHEASRRRGRTMACVTMLVVFMVVAFVNVIGIFIPLLVMLGEKSRKEIPMWNEADNAKGKEKAEIKKAPCGALVVDKRSYRLIDNLQEKSFPLLSDPLACMVIAVAELESVLLVAWSASTLSSPALAMSEIPNSWE